MGSRHRGGIPGLGEGEGRRELVNGEVAQMTPVYRADGSARLLRETDELDGEDLLPGLTIRLAEVFR